MHDYRKCIEISEKKVLAHVAACNALEYFK